MCIHILWLMIKLHSIKKYCNLHTNPNVPFAVVGVVFLGVGIYLNEAVWIALSAVFFALSGSSYMGPKK
jgi:hypothetical protein